MIIRVKHVVLAGVFLAAACSWAMVRPMADDQGAMPGSLEVEIAAS